MFERLSAKFVPLIKEREQGSETGYLNFYLEQTTCHSNKISLVNLSPICCLSYSRSTNIDCFPVPRLTLISRPIKPRKFGTPKLFKRNNLVLLLHRKTNIIQSIN